MTKEQLTIVQEAERWALDEIEKYGSPFLPHFHYSNTKGRELAHTLGADEFIVALGTRFMDVKLGQALRENKLAEHVVMSAEASKEFLSRFNLPQEATSRVINAIEAHHKAVPWKSLEAEVVANADCYRFLRVQNWLGYFMLLGARSSDISGTIQQAEAKLEEKWSILSLDICKKELQPDYELIKQVIAAAKRG